MRSLLLVVPLRPRFFLVLVFDGEATGDAAVVVVHILVFSSGDALVLALSAGDAVMLFTIPPGETAV